METQRFYEELSTQRGEDRAKLVMQQIKKFEEMKKRKKWWQKLSPARKPRITPKPWQ